jgi:hypothetical protein
MNASTTRTLPARSAVTLEELWTIALASRWESLVLSLILLSIGAIIIAGARLSTEAGQPLAMDFNPSLALGTCLLGLYVPLTVWKSLEPARRDYFWAMPVERGWHQLSRTAAGWVWLMAATALFLAYAYTVSRLSGGHAVNSTTVFVGTNTHGVIQPGDMYKIRSVIPAWQWLAPFTGATIAYLLCSALAIAANHPWRWLAGIMLVFWVLTILTFVLETGVVIRMASALLGNHTWFGLDTALTGTLATPQMVHSPTGPVQRLVPKPALGAWVVATVVWMTVGGLGTWIAATRYRES